MTVSMYSISVPIFVQFLSSLSGVVDKAAAFAEAKKVDPAFFLTMRLAPDMYPFATQIEQATKHAVRACSLLSGTDPVEFSGKDASFADLKARIAKAVDYVKTMKPEQIDGTDDKTITMKFSSGERTYTGQTLLLNFILPNFYFHCTTAYDIMRHCGLELVKRDFMGTPYKA
jgi:hypothetical protein